jgi:uncharacterized protein YegP (UPF0339 family)
MSRRQSIQSPISALPPKNGSAHRRQPDHLVVKNTQLKTYGFASPPFDGFAIVTQLPQLQANYGGRHVILLIPHVRDPTTIPKEEVMPGKFVLKKTAKGKFVFNLKASNSVTILTSEGYADRSSALKGIESVRRNAGKDANFEVRAAKNGQPYFVLKAANKEVIGQSEMYASPRSMKKGIASVKANAAAATVEDLTARK